MPPPIAGYAAMLMFLAVPGSHSRANDYAAEYTRSDATIEATNGERDRRTLVRGPIRTQGDYQHGVKALQYGAADLAGASIRTQGDDAFGVYYSGAARLFITDVNISTTGERAHALSSFDERGDDVPDWADASNGDLHMSSGTLTVHGPRAHGLHAVGQTGTVHLGRPMSEPLAQTPAARVRPDADVWIIGNGPRNTAIHAMANRNFTFNGLRIILNGPGSAGIVAGERTVLTGKNLWLDSGAEDSIGLDVEGWAPCGVEKRLSRCPAPDTVVNITRGVVDMRGARSPAVELQRTSMHLRDVSLATAADTAYTVGNQAGLFKYEGKAARATLSSNGSALRAWIRSPKESAVFQLTKADVLSTADTLLDVVRVAGAEPVRPQGSYHVMLKLNDTKAQGAIQGDPQARVRMYLANGSIWQGHTDIGGNIYITGRSAWVMTENSTVDSMMMYGSSTLRFAQPHSQPGAVPRFRTLTIRDGLNGRGRFEMRTHLTSGAADMLDIHGAVNGSFAILITDHSGQGADPGPHTRHGPRAVPIVRAPRGDASFVLENPGQSVEVQGHRYTLNKKVTAAGIVWSLDRNGDDVDGDADPRADGDGGKNGNSPSKDDGANPDSSSGDAGANAGAGAGTGTADANADAELEVDADADAEIPGTIFISSDGADATQPSHAIQTALINNGGIASASALWTAALRSMEHRVHALRDGGGLAQAATDAPSAIGTGLWIRGIDSRQHLHQPASGGYIQSLWGYVLGADRSAEVAAGRWHLGAMVSQIDAHRSFDDGKGSSSAVLFGAYAVLQLDNGGYASVAASAGHFRNTVHASGPTAGDTATGRFHNPGAGIAIAAGRRLDTGHGWFVEPGAGLDYFHAGGVRYTLSDGTAVHDRGGYSLQSRAGARAGRRMDLANGDVATPYVRFDWIHEFGNRGILHADDTVLRTNLSGSRFEIGGGIEARLGKRHFVHADVEFGRGDHLSRSRAVVAGYQYRW